MKRIGLLILLLGAISWGLLAWATLDSFSVEKIADWAAVVGLAGIAVCGGLRFWDNRRSLDLKDAVDYGSLREQVTAASLKLERERQAFRQERAFYFESDDVDEPDPEEEPDWSDQDRQVVELLHQESEKLFRNLVENVYDRDGVFDRVQLGDDLIGLVESVARVYQPESEHPLLETSVEKLLRAANRASIQLLVHLDDLPLDVKSITLRDAYERVRSATKYYGYYKKVEPYWNYARPIYQIGRIAMGANPLTLGVGWAVSEVVKRQSVKVAHSWALRMFHDTVRIFGNEAAEIFGGNYRHRDAGWIYATELVTFVAEQNLSGKPRDAALRELAGTPLRSDYDRLHLFRCLALGQKGPLRNESWPSVLAPEQRAGTAERIERFVQKQSIATSGKSFEQWKTAAEKRLGVVLQFDLDEKMSEAQAREAALRSLASFLVQFKGQEPESVARLVQDTEIFKAISPAQQRSRFLQEIRTQPPMLFELPTFPHGTSTLSQLLDALIQMELVVAPPVDNFDELLVEITGYFREDASKWTARYETRCKESLKNCPGDGCRLSGRAARSLLSQLAAEEIQFVFAGVKIQGRNEEATLTGTSDRLRLFGDVLLWSAKKGAISLTEIRHPVSNDCQIDGGTFSAPIASTADTPRILIPGRKMLTYEKRFAALLEWVPENR